MKKRWGCVVVPLLIVGGLYFAILMGVFKSEERKFAEATCDPYSVPDDKFEACITRNFGPGTDLSRLQKYVAGAGFLNWASKQHDNGRFVKYVRIEDVVEKQHPWRKAIIVKYVINYNDKSKQISQIYLIQGSSVEGWN